MSSRDVIFDVLSQHVYDHEQPKLMYLSFDQIEKRYPQISSCDFDDFVHGRFLPTRYQRLYEVLMCLCCTEVKENRLYDRIHQCYLSEIRVKSTVMTGIVLRTFCYFKLVFPAALFFYENPTYDKCTIDAKRLILKKYSCVLSSTTTGTHANKQYDLSEGWKLKWMYIKGHVSNQQLYTFNVLNNAKLNKPSTERKVNDVCVVKYRDIEHIATTIYQDFSHVVNRRKFVICNERVALSKYDGLFKLKFSVSRHEKIVLGGYAIDTHEPLYFLFNRKEDLLCLIQIHNTYVREGKCIDCNEIPIPRDESATCIPIQSLEKYVKRLSQTKRVSVVPSGFTNRQQTMSIQTLRDEIEKSGFASVYDLKDYNTLAYVKNRVLHFTTTVKQPFSSKPFYEKKGKKLIRIEKMVQAMTMTRYKTDNTVSFNVNYQGPLSAIQLALCRFLNENTERGCRIVKELWVSNVCTTLDTVHSGILNTHVYRQKCLKRQGQVSYPMMNFPAMVTLLNDTDQKKTKSIINNRISLNTCRMYGDELKCSLEKNVTMLRQCSEIDERLVRIFYEIEFHVKELLSRNVVLLIHLLYLHQDEHGYTDDDIIRFFKEKMLCSRMLTTSNRSFSTYNLYNKSYLSDAISNVSVKSVKRYDVKPPTIEREELYEEYKKQFRDVGTLNRKVYRHRGRNANLFDLILNSKDEFFGSSRCTKLLSMLRRKYACHPYARISIKIINAFREYKYGDLSDEASVRNEH